MKTLDAKIGIIIILLNYHFYQVQKELNPCVLYIYIYTHNTVYNMVYTVYIYGKNFNNKKISKCAFMTFFFWILSFRGMDFKQRDIHFSGFIKISSFVFRS